MILLVTNQRDITSDYIVLELQRRGRPYFRLNTETLPQCRVTMAGVQQDHWSIRFGERVVEGAHVTAAYLRRPGTPAPDAALSEAGDRHYCQTEWNAFLKSLYARLEGRWLNAPQAIVGAEDKPRQLLLAQQLGFSVPQALITNDAAAAASLVEAGGMIVKPLREPLLGGDTEQVMFTSRLDASTELDSASFAAAPVIVQREIAKRADIRATVVGGRVFAAAIGSQHLAETEVDWRRGSVPDLPHEAIKLPPDLVEQCVRLTEKLGLRFGAIDLIEDRDGQYWFLEINPNGQWAWIENRTGLPIAAAIVDELERLGGR